MMSMQQTFIMAVCEKGFWSQTDLNRMCFCCSTVAGHRDIGSKAELLQYVQLFKYICDVSPVLQTLFNQASVPLALIQPR